MSCDSCACDVTCSPYQANSSVQTNLLQHPKVDWYKTHSILAHSLLTHMTCVKLFKDFQSLSRIAHCNWNSGVSHAICQWSSHEALPLHPVITCVIAVCNVGLETLKQLYRLQVLSAMCTLHALCTSCLNSQVYSMHICINYTFNPCMQCLGVFRNCSHFTYSVLVVIPKRGTLP